MAAVRQRPQSVPSSPGRKPAPVGVAGPRPALRSARPNGSDADRFRSDAERSSAAGAPPGARASHEAAAARGDGPAGFPNEMRRETWGNVASGGSPARPASGGSSVASEEKEHEPRRRRHPGFYMSPSGYCHTRGAFYKPPPGADNFRQDAWTCCGETSRSAPGCQPCKPKKQGEKQKQRRRESQPPSPTGSLDSSGSFSTPRRRGRPSTAGSPGGGFSPGPAWGWGSEARLQGLRVKGYSKLDSL